jgi:hypothetical protein
LDWLPSSLVPPGTTVRPEVLVVVAVIGFCVLVTLLRTLPFGAWSFFILLAVAIVIINAVQRRR